MMIIKKIFLLLYLLFFNTVFANLYCINFINGNFIISWEKETKTKICKEGTVKIFFKFYLVGMLEYRKYNMDSSCYISSIKIEPYFQQKGIGKNFLKHVCEELTKQGIKLIWLIAYPTDTDDLDEAQEKIPKLIKFYESCNFEQFGNQKNKLTYNSNKILSKL